MRNADRDNAVRHRWPQKSAPLQSLREQTRALAVMPNDLDQVAAAVTPSAEEAKPLSKDDRRLQPMPAARNGLIEIDLGNRRRIRVDAQVDPEALARVLDVLERR